MSTHTVDTARRVLDVQRRYAAAAREVAERFKDETEALRDQYLAEMREVTGESQPDPGWAQAVWLWLR